MYYAKINVLLEFSILSIHMYVTGFGKRVIHAQYFDFSGVQLSLCLRYSFKIW